MLETIRDLTLTVSPILALFGYFQSLEQRKDEQLKDLQLRLSNPDSAVLRSTSAARLPGFHAYKQYLFLGRPYRTQAISFARSALKAEEVKFVRQELMDVLRKMLSVDEQARLSWLDMQDTPLHELILYDFVFNGFNLTSARLHDSDLGRAKFVNSKLWKANLSHSKLKDADFTDAEIYDTNFNNADLENAVLLTQRCNSNTTFVSANLKGAKISKKVKTLCNFTASNINEAIVVD